SLGGVFKEQLQFDEAERCLRRALRLKPDFVEALALLGNTLELQGRFAEALATFERALALKRRDDVRIKAALLLPVVYESIEDLERCRRRVEEEVSRLASEDLAIDDMDQAAGATGFFLAYQGKD